MKLAGYGGHFDEEEPADGVVAAFVRVFEILVVPIMGIFGVVVFGPWLGAMDAVAKELVVEIHEVDLRVASGAGGNNSIVPASSAMPSGHAGKPVA